ncbi:sirohydrochlorin chelatase [Fortiea contorta]|uniref:sirohydrochlorin chelatase n=1 Tax=Fortiea contorta TaxID=1892405 RepID=UPI00034C9BB7|nr:sirohydrochlorin chelatase [Fortiea contorta]
MTPTRHSACTLVSHGSRDPRPGMAMEQLADLIRQKLPSHDQKKLVGVAYLELALQPLHEQITDFARSAFEAGCDRLKIIPLFLSPGVHVTQDVPAEVALAQQTLRQDIIINLQPYLGSHPSLANLLIQPITAKNSVPWILLAHGSRHPDAQQFLETLAAKLGTSLAYWSVSASLESRVKELIAAGNREIGILPYFLCPGGITDAIAVYVETLKLQFPSVNFHLAAPLGASVELAELIWDLINK